MTRRPRSDGIENRQAVLDAARGLYREHGSGVALAAIAQHAGVSRTTISRHFATRGDLEIALMAESTRRVEQRASELEDSPEGLRLLFRFLLQLNMDSRSLLPGQHHADSAAVDELAARTMAAFASVMPSSYTPAASERMLSDIGIAIRLSLGIAGHTAPSTAAERERAIELLELALFGAHDGRSS